MDKGLLGFCRWVGNPGGRPSAPSVPTPTSRARRPPTPERWEAVARSVDRGYFFSAMLAVEDQSDFCTSLYAALSNVNPSFFAK